MTGMVWQVVQEKDQKKRKAGRTKLGGGGVGRRAYEIFAGSFVVRFVGAAFGLLISSVGLMRDLAGNGIRFDARGGEKWVADAGYARSVASGAGGRRDRRGGDRSH